MSKLETIVDCPIDYWPYSHPRMTKNSEYIFWGSDSVELYERNIKYQPKDWIFRDQKINYKFNKQGLRMNVDVEDVIEKDFIYFSGTSFGLGIGLNLENTVPYMLGKEAKLEYINFAGPTYSIKLQIMSFFNYLNLNHKLPKMLVIEYSPVMGYTFIDDDKFICFYYGKYASKNYTKYYEAYSTLVDTNFTYIEALGYRNMLIATCKRLGIKLIEISFNKDEKFITNNGILFVDTESNIQDINYCFARDLRKDQGVYIAHPGIGIHAEMTEKILAII